MHESPEFQARLRQLRADIRERHASVVFPRRILSPVDSAVADLAGISARAPEECAVTGFALFGGASGVILKNQGPGNWFLVGMPRVSAHDPLKLNISTILMPQLPKGDADRCLHRPAGNATPPKGFCFPGLRDNLPTMPGIKAHGFSGYRRIAEAGCVHAPKSRGRRDSRAGRIGADFGGN